MDSIAFIRHMIDSVRRQTDDSMKDTTVEQFNWAPPGTASPISAVLVHLLNGEDFFFQTIIQGRPKLWDSDGWGEKTGVKNTPDFGGNWEEFKQMTLALEPVLAYQGALRAAEDAYLDTLNPEELEREVEFSPNENTVAAILIHIISHSFCHAGEIAVLKGIQGVKGLPY
jgi:uncharacterized damage-inducible protein DinB